MTESPNIISLSGDKPGSERVPLPSGGWVDLRTEATYGASRALRRLGAKLAAKTPIRQKGGEVVLATDEHGDIDIPGEAAAEYAWASENFPVIYMLRGWSYDLPLPTLENMDSLDELSIADGRFLMNEATRRYEALTEFKANPDDHGDPDSPTPSSSDTASRSEGTASGGSAPNTTTTASSG